MPEVLLVAHPLGDALAGKLRPVVELQRRRHLQPKLQLVGPIGIGRAKVVRRPLDPDDAGADVPRKRLRPRPVLGVADGPGFDRIGDEVGDGLNHRFGRQERMDAGAAFVEDFFGPSAIGLGAGGEIAVKRLQEVRVLAPDVGDDLVAVRRHETRGMDQDPMELRGMGKAIPVYLFHLPRFVGMEEEVAAGGAPGERQGGAFIDRCGVGSYCLDRCECRADRGLSVLGRLAHHAWRMGHGRRRPSLHENTAQSRSACLVWGDVGRICFCFG